MEHESPTNMLRVYNAGGVRHKDRLVEKETNFTATLPHGPVVSVRLVVWNVKELWCMRLLDAHNTHLLGQKNRLIDESVVHNRRVFN